MRMGVALLVGLVVRLLLGNLVVVWFGLFTRGRWNGNVVVASSFVDVAIVVAVSSCKMKGREESRFERLFSQSQFTLY